jgi:predicted dehydrogenase
MSGSENINRRKFISKTSKVAAASAVLPYASIAKTAPKEKLRLALVGTGSRGMNMWGKQVIDTYKDYVEMVALCDINHKRLAWAKDYLGVNLKTYSSKDFDLMIKETKPDTVIVTTTDSFHEKYIVRAMELGCNAISEKPICTEAEQCQNILDTEVKTGKKVNVGFNVRYMVESEEMKKIISSGELGKIISVDYQEYLDTSHGASYFRRWHGKQKYSGSLLMHKSSHHFDLINWLLESEPEEVKAMGKTAFYGSNKSFRGRNCRTCQFTDKCEFYWDMTTSESNMAMYGNCEDVDGYYRDGCVWDNEIDSHDTASVQVGYENGTILTYTLNAFLPYEGQYISFIGEKGRLDVRLNSRQPWDVEAPFEFRLTKNRETSKKWYLKPGSGGHGGSDDKLKSMLFKPNQSDPWGRKAGSRAGIMSSLVGIAARKSIETGNAVKIASLVDFPTVWRG